LRKLCVEYDADPDAYKSWTFDSAIYGAPSVKAALRRAHHDKCAFCESKVTQVAYGDVEHFRPKSGYRQRSSDPLVQPGYYWLAYDWSNLLFSCQLCNQRHKGNLFPLADVRKRAKFRDHHMSEEPLFVNPAIEDPSIFVEFNEEYIRPIVSSVRGTATINALGLNRDELVEMRRDYLAPIKLLIECRALLVNRLAMEMKPEVEDHLGAIDAQLARCALDSAQYAAMVRAVLEAAQLAQIRPQSVTRRR
jgi:uncharacterized protein (TIGR02646 family)